MTITFLYIKQVCQGHPMKNRHQSQEQDTVKKSFGSTLLHVYVQIHGLNEIIYQSYKLMFGHVAKGSIKL